MSYGYPPYGQPPQGGPPAPGGGYPPQPQGYGGYPPQQPGGGYPPQSGYPPAPGSAAYPPAPGGGAYPPAPGGAGYPPAAGGGYPPATGGGYPPSGGYPQAGGYPPMPGQSGGLGFENLGSSGPPQPPAQNYAQAPGGYYGASAPGGYGQPAAAYPSAPGQQPGYPSQPYGAPPAAGYQPPGAYGAPAPSKAKGGAHQLATGMAAMTIATHGTVRPFSPFNAEDDAKILRKAMKGLGTDEKAIINVIGYRSNKQRQDIILAYKQAFGKDLISDLKSELSGNFESLVKALFMKPRQYDAYCLEKAMSGVGTDEAALIEILVSRTNAEINEIKEIFKQKRKNLEKELKSESSGHFGRLLVSLCNASRNETGHVDQAKARADATALYQAGEKKWGTDESTFNMIMCSRSIPQLRATFEEYRKVANRDIIKSIESEFSGDIEDGLKAIVETAMNASAYFAKRLHKAMAGAGTKDNTLIRIVVSRSEVDMVEIKQEFQRMFGKSLASYVSGDTGGDYKKLLLAIIGS